MDELSEIAKYIYGRLADNQIISNFVGRHPTKNIKQIYYNIAIEKSVMPYCVYSYITSVKRHEQGFLIASFYVQFFADTINGVDYSIFQLPMGQLNTALVKTQQDGLDDDWVQGCQENRSISGVDDISGKTIIRVGKEYQLWCRVMS